MNRKLLGGVLALPVLLLVPRVASAAAITLFDANLVTPPGWYDGTGNPNGGFTVTVDNGIELGLRAKYRQNPAVINTSNNVYSVVPGPETPATNGGSPGVPSDAAWNYEFSINLQPGGADGNSGQFLAAIAGNSFITIQDLTAGTTSGPVSLFSAFAFDDSLFGPSGKQAETAPEFATDWGAQNSENPVFGNFGIPFSFNADDYYRISLSVGTSAGVLGTDSIDVSVGGATAPTVPEPATLVLLGTAMLGLSIVGRRHWMSQRN
jgi:hypothetical protein